MPTTEIKPLWTPRNVDKTQIERFRALVQKKYNVALEDYAALHQWSVEHIPEFWAEVWDWPAFGAGAKVEQGGVIASKKWDTILDESIPISDIPSWFVGARLNWAENILRAASEPALADKPALIECCEPPKGESLTYKRITWSELYAKVHAVQQSLVKEGLKKGMVFGYYGPTCAEAVILLLAVTSVGGIFSSSASDFGPAGVLERLSQFGSSLFGLVGATSVRYNGKVLPQLPKLAEVVTGLGFSKKKVWIVDYLGEGSEVEGWRKWSELESGQVEGKIVFEQVEFDHPLWVLFSSGTTGKPKPIVHRAGGILLQSKKEHVIHGDLGTEDVVFYYTTPGWMMFNYLVAALGAGSTVVLFDGSPLFRPELLWDMSEELGVTVFGTSAKYLDVLSKGYVPKDHHPLKALKQVLSTGSPLKAELFEWVYENVKSDGDLLLGSITGGTDICSLFAGHNAALPVYSGEIQCITLGMAIASYSEDGVALSPGEAGDLVCTKPFPCMPVFFWNDAGGKRYRESYFEKFEGVWAHGDYCVISESRQGNGGGITMLGRSDGVLNPSGIRFGSSEIYEVLDTFSPSTASSPNDPAAAFAVIEDSLVVGQKTAGGSDERVVLFLKMVDGHVLEESLLKEIRLRIRTRRSARHVPERILQVQDIPHTINGKKIEVPIKKILGGAAISTINLATLRNPECLAEYVTLGDVLRKEVQ